MCSSKEAIDSLSKTWRLTPSLCSLRGGWEQRNTVDPFLRKFGGKEEERLVAEVAEVGGQHKGIKKIQVRLNMTKQ